VIGLAGVAAIVLMFDVLRGDVGGRRGTMARARRLLVVATDPETEAGADAWIDAQRDERPDLQCFLLTAPEGQDLWIAVDDAIESERPDAVVVVRHARERHGPEEGTFARLKQEGRLPVDAVYVEEEVRA
jgi:hypothetical protein